MPYHGQTASGKNNAKRFAVALCFFTLLPLLLLLAGSSSVSVKNGCNSGRCKSDVKAVPSNKFRVALCESFPKSGFFFFYTSPSAASEKGIAPVCRHECSCPAGQQSPVGKPDVFHNLSFSASLLPDRIATFQCQMPDRIVGASCTPRYLQYSLHHLRSVILIS